MAEAGAAEAGRGRGPAEPETGPAREPEAEPEAEPPPGAGSPPRAGAPGGGAPPGGGEAQCAICLEWHPLEAAGFLDGCFHAFCLPCSIAWSDVQAEAARARRLPAAPRRCPLCKAPFESIVHGLRSAGPGAGAGPGGAGTEGLDGCRRLHVASDRSEAVGARLSRAQHARLRLYAAAEAEAATTASTEGAGPGPKRPREEAAGAGRAKAPKSGPEQRNPSRVRAGNSRNVALVRARDPGWEVGRWVRRELQALLGAPAESLELLASLVAALLLAPRPPRDAKAATPDTEAAVRAAVAGVLPEARAGAFAREALGFAASGLTVASHDAAVLGPLRDPDDG